MRRNANVTLRGDRNECPTCGELFNSTAAFDKHRTGEFMKVRRCLTVAEMTEKGMEKRADGFWVGSRMPNMAEFTSPIITGERETASVIPG